MKKRNRQPRSREALNSELIRRPIRRCWPLFLLPTALAFCIGFLYPFLLGLYRSFCEFTSPVDYHWAGFSNYFRAFADEGFRRAFGFTAAYAVVSILIINVCAFALAYALTQKLRGSNIFRTVLFMPNLIGGIVLGYIWKLIFDAFLRSASLQPLLTNATYGFWGLVILVAWQQIGYMMIIYIAGLQAIPDDMLEAAKIDGAGEPPADAGDEPCGHGRAQQDERDGQYGDDDAVQQGLEERIVAERHALDIVARSCECAGIRQGERVGVDGAVRLERVDEHLDNGHNIEDAHEGEQHGQHDAADVALFLTERSLHHCCTSFVRVARSWSRASAATRMKNITASAWATPFQLLPIPFVLKMCRASISVL